jgi:hypothetical protein
MECGHSISILFDHTVCCKTNFTRRERNRKTLRATSDIPNTAGGSLATFSYLSNIYLFSCPNTLLKCLSWSACKQRQFLGLLVFPLAQIDLCLCMNLCGIGTLSGILITMYSAFYQATICTSRSSYDFDHVDNVPWVTTAGVVLDSAEAPLHINPLAAARYEITTHREI